MSTSRRIGWGVACIWLLLVGGSLYLILHTPWLGLQVHAVDQRVVVVDAQGPAQAVPLGTQLRGLRHPEGKWLELSVADLNPEPSYLRSYAELQTFYDHQNAIHDILSAPTVELRDGAGHVTRIAPQHWRPLRTVPAHVWIQFAFTSLILLVAGAAVSANPRDTAARMVLLSSVGIVNCFCAHAIYSSRELAIPGVLFNTLISVNHVSALILGGGGSARAMWHFPRPLSPALGGWTFMLLGALFAVIGQLRLVPTLNLGFGLPLMVMFGCTISVALWQWRRARGRPLHRAMLKWWMLPWLIGVGPYAALLVLPGMSGAGPYAGQTLGWGFMTLIFVGLGLGVTRFRLFYLNPANLWVWAVTGTICALLIVLLRLLMADLWIASCLGIAAAGLIYFPVREFLWSLQPHQRARLETALEAISRRASSTHTLADVTRNWRGALIDVFRPQDVQILGAHSGDVTLIDGETLDVSIATHGGQLRMLRPFDGRSLFSPHDAALAQTMGSLFSTLADYCEAHECGRREERAQLALQLGARLSERLRKLRELSENSDVHPLLDQAESKLETIIAQLDTPPCALGEALPQWREMFIAICKAGGLRAEVDAEIACADRHLSALQRVAATRMVQETTSNILRHSSASIARLRVCCDAQTLSLTVEDDGRVNLDTLQHGRGFRGLLERSAALGGSLRVSVSALGGLSVQQTLPVESAVIPCSGDTAPRPAG